MLHFRSQSLCSDTLVGDVGKQLCAALNVLYHADAADGAV